MSVRFMHNGIVSLHVRVRSDGRTRWKRQNTNTIATHKTCAFVWWPYGGPSAGKWQLTHIAHVNSVNMVKYLIIIMMWMWRVYERQPHCFATPSPSRSTATNRKKPQIFVQFSRAPHANSSRQWRLDGFWIRFTVYFSPEFLLLLNSSAINESEWVVCYSINDNGVTSAKCTRYSTRCDAIENVHTIIITIPNQKQYQYLKRFHLWQRSAVNYIQIESIHTTESTDTYYAIKWNWRYTACERLLISKWIRDSVIIFHLSLLCGIRSVDVNKSVQVVRYGVSKPNAEHVRSVMEVDPECEFMIYGECVINNADQFQ